MSCKEYVEEFLKKTEEIMQNPILLAVEIKSFVSR